MSERCMGWVAVAALTGCQIEAAVSAVTEVRPFEESSSTATGETPGATSEVSASAGEDGSGSEGEGSGAGSGVSASAGDGEGLPEDPPPTISSFTVSPTMMSVAGPITIEVAHSEDVVEVEIWRGGALAFAVEPTWDAGTTTTLPIVHAPGDEGEVLLHAVVRDAGGQTATSAVASVMVELPASGSLAWEKVLPLGSHAEARAVAVSGSVMAAGGFLVLGDIFASPFLHMLDAGGEQSGSGQDLPAGSLVLGLAARPGGGFVAAGALKEDVDWLDSRPWARLYAESGAATSKVWLGEPTSIVHAATTLPDGRVVLAGAVLTHTQPSRWDARVWILGPDLGGVPVVVTWENPEKPEWKGQISDEAMAVTCEPGGMILIGGTTGVFELVQNQYVPIQRAFVLRLSGGGSVLDTWVASPLLGSESAGLGISVDDGEVLLAGFSRTQPYQETRPMLVQLGATLEVEASWIDFMGPVGSSEARRLVRSPSGELIAGITRYSVGLGTDLEVLAADDLAGMAEPTWRHVFPDPLFTDQRLTDLLVSEYGYVHFVGWTYDEAAKRRRPVAGMLHP